MPWSTTGDCVNGSVQPNRWEQLVGGVVQHHTEAGSPEGRVRFPKPAAMSPRRVPVVHALQLQALALMVRTPLAEHLRSRRISYTYYRILIKSQCPPSGVQARPDRIDKIGPSCHRGFPFKEMWVDSKGYCGGRPWHSWGHIRRLQINHTKGRNRTQSAAQLEFWLNR